MQNLHKKRRPDGQKTAEALLFTQLRRICSPLSRDWTSTTEQNGVSPLIIILRIVTLDQIPAAKSEQRAEHKALDASAPDA